MTATSTNIPQSPPHGASCSSASALHLIYLPSTFACTYVQLCICYHHRPPPHSASCLSASGWMENSTSASCNWWHPPHVPEEYLYKMQRSECKEHQPSICWPVQDQLSTMQPSLYRDLSPILSGKWCAPRCKLHWFVMGFSDTVYSLIFRLPNFSAPT